MSFDPRAMRLQRLFGGQHIEPGDAGDRELARLIAEQYAAFKKAGKDVPVVIDAGPRTPLQFVLGTFALCRGAGITRVELGVGTAVTR